MRFVTRVTKVVTILLLGILLTRLLWGWYTYDPVRGVWEKEWINLLEKDYPENLQNIIETTGDFGRRAIQINLIRIQGL